MLCSLPNTKQKKSIPLGSRTPELLLAYEPLRLRSLLREERDGLK